MKTAIAIISLFIVLSIIDFTTTIYAVGNGIGQEGNVLMAKAIENGFYSIVKAGGIVLISLFLAKLSRRHEKAFKVAGYLAIAVTLLAVVNNFMVINASAVVVGSNVQVVGAGYSNFYYDSDYHEFLYYTTDNGGEIHIVTLDDSGMVNNDATIVTNISGVKGLCIYKDGYVYFSIDSSNNELDGIWKRNTRSTNPLDFGQLHDDANYFVHISCQIMYDLTPIGNRIYGFNGYYVYYVDTTTWTVATLGKLQPPGWGARTARDIAVNNYYVYALGYYPGPYINVFLFNHTTGNIDQATKSEKGNGHLMFLSQQYLYFFGKYKYPLKSNGTLDENNKTSLASVSSTHFGAEIYNSKLAVYINDNYQAEIYTLDSVFIPEPKTGGGNTGGGGGGTGTTQYYNVSLYFVNAENSQFLSDAFVTMYVSKGGQTQFSLNQIVDNGYTFTAEEGSTVTITYAYRDGYVSEISQTGSAISLVLDPFINPLLATTDHVNITIKFYPTEQNVSVHFIFLDAMTNAQIDNVTLVITDSGGNEIVNGTFDCSYTLEDAVRGEYYWYNVTKEGYCPYWNGFQVPYGDVQDYYINIYLVPILGDEYVTDPVNNTIVEFYVLDSYSYEPLSGAVVTLNGMSKVTNSQGFAYFEVAKNSTYSYLVQRAGYYTKSGVVEVGTETAVVTVYMLEMPSATPTTPTMTPTGGGGTGGTTGGGGGIQTGYTPDEGLRETARETLTQFYQAVPQFFGLIFLLFLMAAMKSVMRR